MTDTSRLTRVNELVTEVFGDRERLTRTDLQQRTAKLDLSPVLARLVDMLPDGEYDQRRAAAELARIQEEEGMWRDESRLPLSDLDRALATSAGDGQVDDPTGNEAGPAEAFGDRQSTPARPSWEGPIGPH